MPIASAPSIIHFLFSARRARAFAPLLLAFTTVVSAAVAPPRPDGKKVFGSDAAPAPGTPPEVLELRDAVRLALRESPELKSFAWRAESALARIRQAALWPNPEIELERENFGGTGRFSGTEAAEDTLAISQLLPLGGDLKQRRRLAEAESDQAAWDYHAARLEVVRDTSRRYIETLAARRYLDLARRELELARRLETVTEKRVAAGEASPVERSRVAVPLVEAELQLARATLAHTAARQRLALAWSQRGLGEIRLSGSLDELAPLPEPDALVATVNHSPEVARWAAAISASDAARKLARAKAIPDPVLRFGVKRDGLSDDHGLVVGISLPLPLFDRQQGSIAAARSSERAARESRRAAELRIESTLSSGYFTLAVAHAESTALRDRALPAAREAYEATLKAFEEGQLAYLDVLDSNQSLLELESRQIDALTAYHVARVEITALLGGRLPEISQ